MYKCECLCVRFWVLGCMFCRLTQIIWIKAAPLHCPHVFNILSTLLYSTLSRCVFWIIYCAAAKYSGHIFVLYIWFIRIYKEWFKYISTYIRDSVVKDMLILCLYSCGSGMVRKHTFYIVSIYYSWIMFTFSGFFLNIINANIIAKYLRPQQTILVVDSDSHL